MKNKVYESFDKAIEDVFDGAIISYSHFGTASEALNLMEALTRKDVKDLTIVSNMAFPRRQTAPGSSLPTYNSTDVIYQPGKVKRVITGFSSYVYNTEGDPNIRLFDEVITRDIEFIPVPYGNLCTRLEAAACGYGGILTPVGVGTYLEEYCETMIVDGKEYLLEKPLRPDFGFVKAWKADKLGNLVYKRMMRTHNPLVARASNITIAEVLEIVEPGEIDPDDIHTPHIYVDRIVKVPHGGAGSFEWNETQKVLQFGPRSSRRGGTAAQPPPGRD
jgi:3-oxoacid CoA-transferase subunit A